MIFIVESSPIISKCIAKACAGHQIKKFNDAISAISALNGNLPNLIFLNTLLTGPDGFTFLNELLSYDDTAKIPIVLISDNFINLDLSAYGVIAALNTETMTPPDIKKYATEYDSPASNRSHDV